MTKKILASIVILIATMFLLGNGNGREYQEHVEYVMVGQGDTMDGMDYCVDCMYSCYMHEKSYCAKNNKEISIFDAPCNDFVSVEDYRKILLEVAKQFAEDTNVKE